jgi:hypothetical protein
MRAVTTYCCSRKKQLIIGCAANAHHILGWGHTSAQNASVVTSVMASVVEIERNQ